jgi:hypothetical protein
LSSKLSIRFLVLLSCIVAVATLAQEFRLDRAAEADRTGAAAIERDLGAVAIKLADLRAAQTAYLAAGQNPQFWTQRTTELAAEIQGELTRLRGLTRSTDGTTRLDAAAASFGELMAADARARKNLSPEQLLVASDIVLAESLDVAQRTSAEVTGARAAEARAADAAAERRSLQRLATAGGGMFVVLCCAFAAMRLVRKSVPAAASPAATMAQMLRELPPPVRTQAGSAHQAPSATGTASASPAAARPALPLNLPDAAELCVDLARVMDARDLPALLQRAATLLDATGVIVWVVDGGGSTLQPLLAHGYPDRVIRRLGTLDAGGDNVTALAYQSLRPQTMNGGTASDAGALAVPLIAASGCSGVLAAEIRQSRPGPESIALARIVAAQLATVIGPTSAASSTADSLARATGD